MNIADKISSDHEGDSSQLQAIFSDSQRIMLEAPAGCGKTKTMVSKIAYILANKTLCINKKILALTFSVNAAYKMKKDITEKLPHMGITAIPTPASLNRKLLITNYHGFSRRVLNRYGYLLNTGIRNVNLFKAYNENNLPEDDVLAMNLNKDELSVLQTFDNALKECDINTIDKYFEDYYNIIINKFVSKKCITYNGYLVVCYKILENYPRLREFYQLLFPYIMIDEFQDTNYVSWKLVKLLIGEKTKLFFMGDSLQRIYGFIGAVPNLLNIAIDEYSMLKISLSKNYRFKNNQDMLLLDRNIRLNAENYLEPNIKENAKVNLSLFETQEEESEYIASVIEELTNPLTNKTVILVQQRNENLNTVLSQILKQGFKYFNALFNEDDKEYKDFHQNSLGIFFENLAISNGRINKAFLNKIHTLICKFYESSKSETIYSLLKLLSAFFNKLLAEYAFLENDEKIGYISDAFTNYALKQSMDYVDEQIFVSTVHGAKGLEWDYVILPDMEPYVFPNFPSLCGDCPKVINHHFCKFKKENISEERFLEELSVFYVAVTRARKEVIFTSSLMRLNAAGSIFRSHVSCLLSLPGIEYK